MDGKGLKAYPKAHLHEVIILDDLKNLCPISPHQMSG